MPNLNISISNAYLAIINLFLFIAIITSNRLGSLNVPIRSKIININPGSLSGLVVRKLRAILILKLRPTSLFRKNGIDKVKRIYQQVIQLNNLAGSAHKIDP
jgi:hypothetical protein